ncbi:uncharacterized protein DUF1080 [Pedobacter duraquae]|uniref:Uncharacterized protein DUF1080 n=2 Tax=Pedobacter duraquae TaxID=425511 RepID=A0A4R6ICL5_9SPHI|nr:uncharacterized protein DUF1080 [Pedobacter duraquae]
MIMKPITFILTALLTTSCYMASAQNNGKPEDTEVWEPIPKSVVTGKLNFAKAPSDALILFDGKNLDEWTMTDQLGAAASWPIEKGIFTVKKGTGNIQTKKSFGNYQLHLEFRIPKNISGTGQGRGNSGLFLAAIGPGDAGYELQILDSYNNKTYVNGMAGSIYKQFIPLANPALAPGEWQTYDVSWTAPIFNADGSVASPARVTVLFNGVTVQNNTVLLGPTQYIGKPAYRVKHGASPIKLQAHGDKSEPISFRNIWIREL